MKYQELSSVQRSNYWALTSIVDVMHEIGLEDENPLTKQFFEAMNVLETNLKIELYTDD